MVWYGAILAQGSKTFAPDTSRWPLACVVGLALHRGQFDLLMVRHAVQFSVPDTFGAGCRWRIWPLVAKAVARLYPFGTAIDHFLRSGPRDFVAGIVRNSFVRYTYMFQMPWWDCSYLRYSLDRRLDGVSAWLVGALWTSCKFLVRFVSGIWGSLWSYARIRVAA